MSLPQPFVTSKGLLKLSHDAYNPTTSAFKHITTSVTSATDQNVRDKDELSDRQEAVYKIKCRDCQATYIGETCRNLNIRLTEQKRVTRNGDMNNHIAEPI